MTSALSRIDGQSPTPQALIAIAHTLRKTELLKRLDPLSLEKLAESCRIIKLPKNGILFHEGEIAQGFYIVHSGVISLSRISLEGRERVISLFHSCECLMTMIGLMTLLL